MNPQETQNTIEEYYQAPLNAWREYSISYFKDLIAGDLEMLHNLVEFIDQQNSLPDDNIAKADKISTYKQETFQYILTMHTKPGTETLDVVHESWLKKSYEIAEGIPKKLRKKQHPERFLVQKGEGIKNILKPVKYTFFQVSRIPTRLYNLVRKEKKKIEYWQQEVPLQGLFLFHFVGRFIQEWNSLEELIKKDFCAQLIEIKKWEELKYTQDEIPTRPELEFSQIENQIVASITEYFDRVKLDFERELELAGTIEYKNSKLEKNFLVNYIRFHKKKWNEIHQNWQNTQTLFFEDWRSDLELEHLKFQIAKSRFKAIQFFDGWMQKTKKESLDLIHSFLSKTKSQFDQSKSDTELNKLIVQSQYEVKKSLDSEIITPLQARVSKNALLNQIDYIEHFINEQVSSLSKAYAVAKYGLYDRGIEADEIQSISNSDLVSYEIIPWMSDELDSIKSQLLTAMNEILVQAGDLDEIVTYTLNTASSILKKENKEEDECINIIRDGLSRSIQKSEEIEANLEESFKKCKDGLHQILEGVETKLQDLTNAENVFDIRLRISKAKAVLKSEAIKERIWGKAHSLTNISKASLSKIQNWLRIQQQRLKGILIPSSLPSAPSRHVSDFLNESNRIMDNLPLVYSQLYSIEPLNDPFLFEGREQEIATIEEAYTYWQEGKFGSLIIKGEKWSGLTSLINFVLLQKKFNMPILRHALKGNHADAAEMRQSFAQMLDEKSFGSTQELIDYLNSGDKKIIILEDIQKLYLRKIYGVKVISDLIEVITSTHSNIFWMVTSTTYAAQYLDKSVQLSSFFTHSVVLSEMSPEQINNLVIKRNRISGFKVHFEEDEGVANDKKYKKLSQEEKQEYLKSSFFKVVNNFAKSNVSMALLCWLLSTRKVDNHTVYISRFNNLDLSFLSQLPMDYIFVLNTLIQHDGLDTAQVSTVLSYPLQKVKVLLLAMEEDGIIVRHENTFMVHPLVYRTVIQLLKAKNLIN